MKKILLAAVITCTIKHTAHAQAVNWASLQKSQRHTISVNTAIDYGATFGVGYAYQLKTTLPILLNAEYSFPGGKNLPDDFKTKIGGQIRLVAVSNFVLTAKMQGVFRRYQNPLARMLNFGSDMSATAGYYRQKWFAAAEAGFDKAIITKFKNSPLAKQNFPGIKDGWYQPATGGNFYYGIQAGYSLRLIDIFLKAGSVIEQDFKTKPLLPFYGQLGANIRLKGKTKKSKYKKL